MNTFNKVPYWLSAVVLAVVIYAAVTIYRIVVKEHADEADDTTDTDSEYYTAEEGNEPDSGSDTSDTEYYTAEEGDEPDAVDKPADVVKETLDAADEITRALYDLASSDGWDSPTRVKNTPPSIKDSAVGKDPPTAVMGTNIANVMNSLASINQTADALEMVEDARKSPL